MNFEKFRRTGELSDITVIVDKTEFKLHTFPLFTKSEYFKKAVQSSTSNPPYVIRLDNDFPGGAVIFNQLADYFYSIPVTIDQKNIVPLRSAACFIQCDALSTLLDERLDKILFMARAKHDLNVSLGLLEQCTGEYQEWARKTRLVDKCFDSIIDSLSYSSIIQSSKVDRDLFVRLPLQWIIELIERCSSESKFAILPLARHYVSVHVLDQSPAHSLLSSTNENGNNEIHSAFTPVAKRDVPKMTEDEKKIILDEIVKGLGNTIEHLPLPWLNAAYEKAVQYKCECEKTLSFHITHAILNSTDFDQNMADIPDDVMASLLERVNKNKEEHIKDPQLLEKLSSLIDSYVEQLRQRGKLTSEQFVKLASCIPKEQRNSHDSLLLALDDILKNDNSTQLTDDEREELLGHIDFSRVNEDTIAACKTNKLIPQQLIADAALSLCTNLRRQLEETQTRLRSAENELLKSRPSYSASTHRTRYYDSPTRYSKSSRYVYPSSIYESPLSNSTYNYSVCHTDNDIDHLLPSKYSPLTLIGRHALYTTYRY